MNDPVAPKNFEVSLIVKTAAAIFLVLITTALLYGSFKSFTVDDGISMTDSISYCDRSYYAKDYADLYDTLTIFDLYSEDFGKYWEVVDAYSVYTAALEWRTAAENGREGADEKMAQALEKLSEMESNVKFPSNLPIISGFVREFDSK